MRERGTDIVEELTGYLQSTTAATVQQAEALQSKSESLAAAQHLLKEFEDHSRDVYIAKHFEGRMSEFKDLFKPSKLTVNIPAHPLFLEPCEYIYIYLYTYL